MSNLWRIIRFVLLTAAVWFILSILIVLLSIGEGGTIDARVTYLILAPILIAPVAAYLYDRNSKQAKTSSINRITSLDVERASERQLIRNLADEHKSALLRNYSRAVRKNDYGAIIKDDRAQVISEFLISFGLPSKIDLLEAISLVDDEINSISYENSQRGLDLSSVPKNGIEFEYWVAEALKKKGYDAQVTQASGDQGVDIIAKRFGKTIAIQCKLYSSPVGNDAVQQATAGKLYYGADISAVVSNQPYTLSATQLAHATGVKLLSTEDLIDPDQALDPLGLRR